MLDSDIIPTKTSKPLKNEGNAIYACHVTQDAYDLARNRSIKRYFIMGEYSPSLFDGAQEAREYGAIGLHAKALSIERRKCFYRAFAAGLVAHEGAMTWVLDCTI